ncbi:hypothetical protein JPM7_2000 [Metamycoplasma equirhinis]|uniref:hypothetical protein n=1 Tax=Metamycoplasma equirhinis TaxID=92402 RepID=UPI00257353BF|nr:hypothetical protein [Metamycoplasma equirhinis]BDX52593.1 hypothetical protein JPM7_2000 [Metamycoplasma equirhinis]
MRADFIKEWAPVLMPILSLLLGLCLTLILTAIKQSKKNKYIRSKLDFLEKENSDNKLDFRLYKEKTDAFIFDLKIDLKKATDENMLLIKKLEMYKTNSSVEYNKELEDKLKEYLKQSDTLSNELLALKEKYAEQSKELIALKIENEQLNKKIKFFEMEKVEQLAFLEQIKKAQELINNIKLSGSESANKLAKEIAQTITPENDFKATSNESKPLGWEKYNEKEKSVL